MLMGTERNVTQFRGERAPVFGRLAVVARKDGFTLVLSVLNSSLLSIMGIGSDINLSLE
jgi:hypothetical protein